MSEDLPAACFAPVAILKQEQKEERTMVICAVSHLALSNPLMPQTVLTIYLFTPKQPQHQQQHPQLTLLLMIPLLLVHENYQTFPCM